MRKADIEEMLKNCNTIKDISNKQNYNVSSAINQNLVKVINKLKEEYDRMDKDKITLNCPAIILIKASDLQYKEQSLSDYINNKIKELVMNNYKIIDYGISGINGNQIYAFIKYTS